MNMKDQIRDAVLHLAWKCIFRDWDSQQAREIAWVSNRHLSSPCKAFQVIKLGLSNVPIAVPIACLKFDNLTTVFQKEGCEAPKFREFRTLRQMSQSTVTEDASQQPSTEMRTRSSASCDVCGC